MTNDNIGATVLEPGADAKERFFDSWFDPIENAMRIGCAPSSKGACAMFLPSGSARGAANNHRSYRDANRGQHPDRRRDAMGAMGQTARMSPSPIPTPSTRVAR